MGRKKILKIISIFTSMALAFTLVFGFSGSAFKVSATSAKITLAGPDTITYGDSLTLTATNNFSITDGILWLYDKTLDEYVSHQDFETNGKDTFTLNANDYKTTGNHVYSVELWNFTGTVRLAQSNAKPVQINKMVPTVTVTQTSPAGRSGVYNETEAFQATASYNGKAVAGTFTWKIDGVDVKDNHNNLITAASISSTLVPGNHAIIAIFVPAASINSLYEGGSNTLNVAVNKYTPVISVAPASQTKSYNEAVTFNYTIDRFSGGTVALFNGNTKISADNAASATGSFTVNGGVFSAGSYGNITVRYAAPAGSFYNNSTSNAVALTVNKITPSVMITRTPAGNVIYGTPVSLDAATAGVPGAFLWSWNSGANTQAGHLLGFSSLPVGINSFRVDFTPTDTTNYNSAFNTASVNVVKADLDLSKITLVPGSKVYDGTTAVAGFILSYEPSVPQEVRDYFNSNKATAFKVAFNSSNASAAQGVTVSDLVISADLLSKYNVSRTFKTGTAAIYKKYITPILSVDTKVYDGTTSATLNVTFAPGAVVGTDVIGATATGFFATASAGTAKPIIVSSINFANNNYAINMFQLPVGVITPKPVTPTVIVASKYYDGTTTAQFGTSFAAGDIISGDAVTVTATGTFLTATAGIQKDMDNMSVSLNNSNYVLNGYSLIKGDINKVLITPAFTVSPKTYDGKTAAAVAVTFTGAVNSENPTATATGEFDTALAGTAKDVTIGITLDTGWDTNYYYSGITFTAKGDITPAILTPKYKVESKVFDGKTDAKVSVSFDGAITGETPTGTATGVFKTPEAGANKPVDVLTVVIDSKWSTNYKLPDVYSKAATGTITEAPVIVVNPAQTPLSPTATVTPAKIPTAQNPKTSDSSPLLGIFLLVMSSATVFGFALKVNTSKKK